MYKFFIPVSPRTKKNSSQIIKNRKTNKIMIIPSKLYMQYEKDCKYHLPNIKKPIDYPINLKCIYHMPTRRKCDLNNLLEATTDMLVHHKILLDDNYNIVFSHDGSRVLYDKENVGTEIEIEEVKEGI